MRLATHASCRLSCSVLPLCLYKPKNIHRVDYLGVERCTICASFYLFCYRDTTEPKQKSLSLSILLIRVLKVHYLACC